MPGNNAKNVSGPPRLSPQRVRELMVRVEARRQEGRNVIKVENEEVQEAYLQPALARFARTTRKTNLLIDAQGVDFGTVIAIQDAAKGAGYERVFFPAPKTAAR